MNTIKVYFWDTSEKSNNAIRNNYDSDELNITEREFNISLDLIDQPIKAIAIDRYFHELDGILLHTIRQLCHFRGIYPKTELLRTMRTTN